MHAVRFVSRFVVNSSDWAATEFGNALSRREGSRGKGSMSARTRNTTTAPRGVLNSCPVERMSKRKKERRFRVRHRNCSMGVEVASTTLTANKMGRYQTGQCWKNSSAASIG